MPQHDPKRILSASSIVLQARALYREVHDRSSLKAAELDALLLYIQLIEAELKRKEFL